MKKWEVAHFIHEEFEANEEMGSLTFHTGRV
jgi:hypothetical protein